MTAQERVAAPAVLLMIAGFVSITFSVLGLVMQAMSMLINFASVGLNASQGQAAGQLAITVVIMAVGLLVYAFFAILGLANGAVLVWGGMNLRTMRNRNLAMAAALVGVLQPLLLTLTSCMGGCSSCGCFFGLPLSLLGVIGGMMALQLLNDPDILAGMGGLEEMPEF
jgi:hypothetical protein